MQTTIIKIDNRRQQRKRSNAVNIPPPPVLRSPPPPVVFLPPPPDLYETNRLTERLARLEAAPVVEPIIKTEPAASVGGGRSSLAERRKLAIKQQRDRVRKMDARRRSLVPRQTSTETQTETIQQAEVVPVATSVSVVESPIDRFRERMRLRLNAVNALPFRTVIEPLDRTQAEENQIRDNRRMGQIRRRAAEREQSKQKIL